MPVVARNRKRKTCIQVYAEVWQDHADADADATECELDELTEYELAKLGFSSGDIAAARGRHVMSRTQVTNATPGQVAQYLWDQLEALAQRAKDGDSMQMELAARSEQLKLLVAAQSKLPPDVSQDDDNRLEPQRLSGQELADAADLLARLEADE